MEVDGDPRGLRGYRFARAPARHRPVAARCGRSVPEHGSDARSWCICFEKKRETRIIREFRELTRITRKEQENRNTERNNPMAELLLKNEVFAIVGAAMEVHREKGFGFAEPVFQECMELELADRGIRANPFVEMPI